MRRKDHSVECEFHPILNAFLWEVEELYNSWEDEVVITSGSERDVYHSYTSLHYADPCCAGDIRSWDQIRHNRGTVPPPQEQVDAIKLKTEAFCSYKNIPEDWIEIILEPTHIHIEYQPKRPSMV